MKPLRPPSPAPHHPSRAVLLVNTHSRKGRLLYKRAKAQLEAAGITLEKAIALADPSTIHETMADIMALSPDLVIIGGGDGTISTASNYLAHTDTVLGYLPLGTTNNFGRGIGLTPLLEDAIATITKGDVLEIDLGKTGSTYFTNMASFGVSVAVATETPRQLKRRFGRLAYAVYSAISTLRHDAMSVDVQTDTGSYSFTTHQFCVAAGVTHSGIPIAVDASVTDHKLVAYALGGKHRFSTLLATIRHGLTSGKRLSEKDVLISQTLTLTFSPPQNYDIDGEPSSGSKQATYTFEVAPRALKVCVPKDFSDGE